MFDIDRQAFESGKAAYRAGTSIADITERHNNLYRTAQQARDAEEYKAAESEAKSYVLGFAEGVIDDIRTLAQARRGLRA